MNTMPKKGGLGKGLDALFAENSSDSAAAVEIRLSDIEPNADQPRRDFDPQALEELSESIARYGLLQPLLVRPLTGGRYQLVAGERRWRASRMAGLSSAPAIIKELSDVETAEIALVENLQREDLNPIEEAEGYRLLMTDYSLTQEQVSERVGRSRSAVANSVRLLSLPEEILGMIKKGEISAGHGRALLAFDNRDAMLAAARAAVSGANVRELERMSKKPDKVKKTAKPASRNSFFDEVELSLSENLGRRVKVRAEKGKGSLQIEFYNADDLKALANKLAE